MESLKRANRFLNLDIKLSLAVFWVVMLIINIGLYILMYIFKEQIFGVGLVSQSSDSQATYISIGGVNLMPSVIFLLVYCFEMYYESFPLALGFSVTRKDFYIASMMNHLFIILIFALVQSIWMKVDIQVVEFLGRNPYVNYGMYNTSTDNIVYIMFSLFLLYLSVTSIFNLLAVLTYRIGYKFWIGVVIIFSLFSRFFYKPIFYFIGQLFSSRINIPQVLILGISAVIMYILSYFVVLNTNIKNKAA